MKTDEKIAFFMELINCNYPLHYWKYNADMKLQETNWPNDLLSDAFFDYIGIKEATEKHLKGGQTTPLILEAESNLLLIIGFQFVNKRSESIYVIGPILGGRDTHMIFRRKLDSYDLSVRLRAAMNRLFDNIPAIPSNTLIQYAVMLHFCLNSEKISMDDVAMHNSISTPQTELSLNGNSHAGVWMNEQLLCKMLADGDSRYKEALQRSHSISHGMKTDIGDSLRYHKNNSLVLLTLCSRACISGGMPPQIGYDLNDYYAQKIEDCSSMTETSKLCKEMLEDYVSRMREIKSNTSVSNSIRSCCEYIKAHLTESLSIEELAKLTGYTEYYFSHKFKKEMGCSVNDYIVREKIERAKLLLTATDQSIQDISDELAFGNRSYFYTCFQKVTGMSPSEYRKAQRH